MRDPHFGGGLFVLVGEWAWRVPHAPEVACPQEQEGQGLEADGFI